MNYYLLMDAVSYLETDLLERHFEEKKKKHQKNGTSMIKRFALAACLCVAIALSTVAVPYIQSLFQDEVIFIHFIGETVTREEGTLTLVHADTENHIVQFKLVKEDYSPIYFEFAGWIFLSERVDEAGVPVSEIQHVEVITPYAFYVPDGGHMVMDDILQITINGEAADTIPCEPGEYNITIDFSEMYNVLDRVYLRVEVLGFDTFLMEESIFPELDNTETSSN